MCQIEIKNVSKSFKSINALDHVSLTLGENKIYGLLGRNGAGKSTLLNIITNRIFADSGEILMNGVSVTENDEIQKKIYLMSEQDMYPDTLKIREIFRWTKEFYPSFDIDYAYKLCEKFVLDPSKKPKQLSTGYKSIYKLILALSVHTPFTFLDEPVLGLDANHRELFYHILLKNYADDPRTFVISTHLIEEISQIIEEIIIIQNGQIIKQEAVEDLLSLGYAVSGTIKLVDEYCKDKKLIGEEILGGLKVAYVLGKKDLSLSFTGLEFSKLDLQKLFIQLTNETYEK